VSDVDELLAATVVPPEKGWVPATLLWIVDDEQVVGRVSIRHGLNEHLLQVGMVRRNGLRHHGAT
jgi:predicted acetyltransferase